jgi:predicted phosphodiesterase
MRVAVVADIHGNFGALEAVVADIRLQSPDLVLNLGDCLSGPLQPRRRSPHGSQLDNDPRQP